MAIIFAVDVCTFSGEVRRRWCEQLRLGNKIPTAAKSVILPDQTNVTCCFLESTGVVVLPRLERLLVNGAGERNIGNSPGRQYAVAIFTRERSNPYLMRLHPEKNLSMHEQDTETRNVNLILDDVANNHLNRDVLEKQWLQMINSVLTFCKKKENIRHWLR
jgi:hypothetical protein